MNDQALRAARTDLLHWMAEKLVGELLAEAQLATQNDCHENRDLHPLLDRPAAGNLPR